jgi:hypothetical protein
MSTITMFPYRKGIPALQHGRQSVLAAKSGSDPTQPLDESSGDASSVATAAYVGMAFAVAAYVQDSLVRLGYSHQEAVVIASLVMLMLVGVSTRGGRK